MQFNPPPQVRAVIYICIVIGTAILVPLNAADVINDVVINVWSSVSGAVSLLAAINVSSK